MMDPPNTKKPTDFSQGPSSPQIISQKQMERQPSASQQSQNMTGNQFNTEKPVVRRQSDFKIATRTTPTTTVVNPTELSIEVKKEKDQEETSSEQQAKDQTPLLKNANGMPYQNPYRMTVNITGCKYEVFRRLCLKEFGFRLIVPPINYNSNNPKEYSLQTMTYNKQTGKNLVVPACEFPNRELSWEIQWQDFGINPDFLSQMNGYQRVNHFLGMYNLARKNTLGTHLRRFRKEFKDQYNFFPHTWLYPSDFHEIQEYNTKKYKKRNEEIAAGTMTQEQSAADPPCMFIVKPEAGCQGKGIFIARKIEDLQLRIDKNLKTQEKAFDQYLKAEENYDTAVRYGVNHDKRQPQYQNGQQGFEITEAPEVVVKDTNYVVQKYIKYPALWQDYKFDFRIYVLITSVIDPMTIFLFNDGLVRLASEKYQGSKDTQDAYKHLTNYSLNKKNENFDDGVHKLKLSQCLKGTMTQKPYKPTKPSACRTAEAIWQDIEAIVVKTVLTVQPQLQHIYRSCQQKEPDCCFELLGFDIMLDAKLKPWLLEVNHTPSFQCDTEVDEAVKTTLLKDTFELLQTSVEQRKQKEWEIRQEKKQQEAQGVYKRVPAKEHCERVRFDFKAFEQKYPNSGFKLIYPKEAPGEDPDLYLKIQARSYDIFRSATGTVPQKREIFDPDFKKKQKEAAAKKKKAAAKKAKKKRVSSNQNPTEGQTNEEGGSSNEEDESNWQDGDPKAEENAVKKHLEEVDKKEKVSTTNVTVAEEKKSTTTIQPQSNQTLPTKRASNMTTQNSKNLEAPRLTHNKPTDMCQCRHSAALNRQQSSTSYQQHSLAVAGNSASMNYPTGECSSCGKMRPIEPIRHEPIKQTTLAPPQQQNAPPRPTVSSHAKKVPLKRETLKLATVGAVGIETSPNTNSVLVMDPNAVHWNSANPHYSQQQQITMTEGEIISRIIQATAQMKMDGKDLHMHKLNHQQLVELFKSHQSQILNPLQQSQHPQRQSQSQFQLNKPQHLPYQQRQNVIQSQLAHHNEQQKNHYIQIQQKAHSTHQSQQSKEDKQSRHESINGWFIQRLQKILDTQGNVKVVQNHNVTHQDPSQDRQYHGAKQKMFTPVQPQTSSAQHVMQSHMGAKNNAALNNNASQRVPQQNQQAIHQGMTNEQLFRQLLPELLDQENLQNLSVKEQKSKAQVASSLRLAQTALLRQQQHRNKSTGPNQTSTSNYTGQQGPTTHMINNSNQILDYINDTHQKVSHSVQPMSHQAMPSSTDNIINMMIQTAGVPKQDMPGPGNQGRGGKMNQQVVAQQQVQQNAGNGKQASSLLFTHRQNLQNVAYKINQQQQYQTSILHEIMKEENKVSQGQRLSQQSHGGSGPPATLVKQGSQQVAGMPNQRQGGASNNPSQQHGGGMGANSGIVVVPGNNNNNNNNGNQVVGRVYVK